MAQHVLRNPAVALIQLEVMPLGLRHAPACVGILFQGLQPLALRLARQVKPELDDEQPFLRQHLLEADDLLDALVELRGAAFLAHMAHDRLGVPVAEQHADLALGRQGAPEAPHEGTLALLVGGFAEGIGKDVARVHPGVEQIDRLPLARALHAIDQDQHRKLVELADIVLGVQQVGTQPGRDAVITRLVDLVAQFGGFEHDTPFFC